MRVAGRTGPADAARPAHHRLVDEVASRVGSRREAGWIVDEAGSRCPGDPGPTARALAERRQAGEPLQYVVGRWPFRWIELALDRRVLIPRPETEQVVGAALAELARLVDVRGATRPGPVCVDLGTGSGAIALSLAVEGAALAPGIDVWGTDASADALAVATANRDALAGDHPVAGRVHLVGGSWFDALPAALAGRVDLLVANPPYVAEEDIDGLDPGVREWEPRSALVAGQGASGAGGAADLEHVVAGAARWLAPGGALVVELDPSQADSLMATARRAGLERVEVRPDLAGRPRMLVGRRP